MTTKLMVPFDVGQKISIHGGPESFWSDVKVKRDAIPVHIFDCYEEDDWETALDSIRIREAHITYEIDIEVKGKNHRIEVEQRGDSFGVHFMNLLKIFSSECLPTGCSVDDALGHFYHRRELAKQVALMYEVDHERWTKMPGFDKKHDMLEYIAYTSYSDNYVDFQNSHELEMRRAITLAEKNAPPYYNLWHWSLDSLFLRNRFKRDDYNIILLENLVLPKYIKGDRAEVLNNYITFLRDTLAQVSVHFPETQLTRGSSGYKVWCYW